MGKHSDFIAVWDPHGCSYLKIPVLITTAPGDNPVQEFMLKTDTLKNGTSVWVYIGSAPLPRVLLLLSRQKNVRTANAGRTVLWNESNSNKWKQNMDFFYLDPLPTNFCISDCRCFIHHSLCCQSFISIPKAYIQYNPANSNPPGEYELGLKCTKGNGNLGRVI